MGFGGLTKKNLDGQSFVERDGEEKSHRPQGAIMQRGYSRRRGRGVGHHGRRHAEGKTCERAEIREGKVGAVGAS